MGGLKEICRMYGGMTIESNGKKVEWIWDYTKEEPRLKSEMTDKEIKENQKVKWLKVKDQITGRMEK